MSRSTPAAGSTITASAASTKMAEASGRRTTGCSPHFGEALSACGRGSLTDIRHLADVTAPQSHHGFRPARTHTAGRQIHAIDRGGLRGISPLGRRCPRLARRHPGRCVKARHAAGQCRPAGRCLPQRCWHRLAISRSTNQKESPMRPPPGLEYERTFTERIEGPLGPTIGSPCARLTCADDARPNTCRTVRRALTCTYS
jgi:hypothetical protein